MGEKTDKIEGRAKQAVGAVTGDEETKREGERQEDKGKLKGKLDSAIDKTQGAFEDVKANRTAVNTKKHKLLRKHEVSKSPSFLW